MKERLHDTLEEERTSSRILVLCGLGGAGKSSLALNYLLSYRKDYSAMFWLNAVSEGSLRRDCEEIHGLLYGKAQPSSVRDIKSVKQWFQGRRSRYLWILDSADNVGGVGATGSIDVERYIPNASCVDVIVTTRSQSVQHMTSLPAVQVASLDRIEARNLFIQRAGMSDLTPKVTEDIGRIVERLGHFALAVKLAGAYMASNPHMKARLGDYLRQLSRHQSSVLDQQPQCHTDRYQQSVRHSWELSCNAVAAKCPAALNLLSFLAFMKPDRIEPEKFTGSRDGVLLVSKNDDLRWRAAITKRGPWDEVILVALATLLDYSLIQWSCENQCYDMHQLVYSWAFDRLSKSEVHLFGTAVLLMHSNGSPGFHQFVASTCLDRLMSIPNASLSDRLVTLWLFGTFGVYHKSYEWKCVSTLGDGFIVRKIFSAEYKIGTHNWVLSGTM
jgi:hypothetical protein